MKNEEIKFEEIDRVGLIAVVHYNQRTKHGNTMHIERHISIPFEEIAATDKKEQQRIKQWLVQRIRTLDKEDAEEDWEVSESWQIKRPSEAVNYPD